MKSVGSFHWSVQVHRSSQMIIPWSDCEGKPEKVLAVPEGSKQTSRQSVLEEQRTSYSAILASNQTEPLRNPVPIRLLAACNPSFPPKPAPTMKPTLSLSLGIIPPLYIPLSDAAIQPSATGNVSPVHLQSHRRHRGLLAKLPVARRIIEIEEAGVWPHSSGVRNKVSVDDDMDCFEIRIMR